MLIHAVSVAMIVGSVSVCPPSESPVSSEGVAIQVELRDDSPPPGAPPSQRAGVGAPAGAVGMAGAPRVDQYINGMLDKTWVTTATSATVKDLTDAIGRAAERKVFVDWERLEKAGIRPDAKIGVPLERVHLEQALRLVNERFEGAGDRIAARRTGDLVEVSTQRAFDRRELETAAYDLRPLLRGLDERRRAERVAKIVGTLSSTVDPDGWSTNGGDTSRVSEAEGRLFVVAPPRVQRSVAWVLEQVSDRPVAGAEMLDRGEPVQTLQSAPSPTPGKRSALDALREQLAWTKVQLGQDLTPEEAASLTEERAVRTLAADNPARAAAEAHADALRRKIAALEAEAPSR